MGKSLIWDCDPGIDDAVAMAVLLCAEDYALKVVTTCAGNLPPETTYANARNLLHLMGRDGIPVCRGASAPLYRKLVLADEVHGESGLGNAVLPPSPIPHDPRTALEAAVELLRGSREPVTLVATGPLTNVAVLLLAHPELRGKLEKIVIMGGAYVGGNVTPSAEFNIAVDPEAAKTVFRCGLPIYLFGLDVTRNALFFQEDIARLEELPNHTGPAFAQILSFQGAVSRKPLLGEKEYGRQGVELHDACAAAYLLRPDLFELIHVNVEVETGGEFTAGCTVVDNYQVTGRPANVYMASACQYAELSGLVFDCLSRMA